MHPKTMIFIDGENLLTRFESMLEEGRKPTEGTIHSEGRYLWHPNLTAIFTNRVARVVYYTSFTGSDDVLFELKNEIASILYNKAEGSSGSKASLVPEVFKKRRKGAKSKSVDINLTTDLLRSAYTDSLDRALVVSGDGDYIPVIKDVMRQGKQVYVASLSSGLNKDLPHTPDHFINLDHMFFIK